MPHREATNKLSNLAEATRLVISQSANGECFQGLGYNPKHDMETAFGDSANPHKEYSHMPIHVMSETKGFTRTIQETFILDEELGNNTIVTISRLSTGNYSLTARLVDPRGQRCQNCLEVDSDREKSLTIPSPATPGTWKLQVESSSTDHVVVSMRVISQIRDLTNEPIVALCEASQKELSEPQEAVIFVDLSKGDNVVLNASVTAVVLNTKGLNCPVPLYDDGNEREVDRLLFLDVEVDAFAFELK
ncbi:hypothetical protein HPB49_010208 [Dermacentor silvarum]|uniref:Uncharacterized protein n=1 Tax=Dermacentor silvarum TaxID=543639 RepID=A0ACB8DNS6_DERSI|nr:hypothetical protein HPB49_010208 [Dermacentor silvarum]